MVIHVSNGVPLKSLFKPYIEVQDVDPNTSMIVARESAVFSNWIPFRQQIQQIGLIQKRNVIVDLSHAKLVDHSVMEKLEEMERDFQLEGLTFDVQGLEALQPLSPDALAARKRGFALMRRVTVVVDESIEQWLEDNFVQRGATGFTAMACRGAGRRELADGTGSVNSKVRIEVVMTPEVCDTVLEFLREEVLPKHHVTASVEAVDVVRRDHFEGSA